MGGMSASAVNKSLWHIVEKYKTSIILALLGAVLIGVGILIPRLDFFKPEPDFTPANEVKNQKPASIKVDIAGAVKNPALHDIKEGARIQDAVNAAGGFTSKADKDWIAKNLNLAQVIGDGTKIYIPRVGEIAGSSNIAGSSLGLASKSVSGNVNINTASTSELDTLPKVGPVTAQKIIDGRPYSSVEDLMNKKILGPKTYEGLKDLVSVQ